LQIFQFIRAAFGELQPSTRHKIGHSRNKNFAGLGLGYDASSRVHRDPADVLASHFNFAGMEARA
jgi:hypothetical protein